jgi:hypothetical protein
LKKRAKAKLTARGSRRKKTWTKRK